MFLRRISDPLTKEQKLAVVSVEDLKAHARITSDDEDDLIAGQIEAAYDFLSGPDGYLNGCALLTETFETTQTSLQGGVPLVMRPFIGTSVESLEVLDPEGLYATVDLSDFVIGYGHPHALLTTFAPLPMPPIAYRSRSDAFRIRYKAGFGDAAAVPTSLKLAIKMLAGHWYANREATTSDNRATPQQLELGLKALCRKYRVSPDHS